MAAGKPRPAPAPRRPSLAGAALGQVIVLLDAAAAWLRRWRHWPVVARVLGVLFAVALPVALVTTNVRLLFTTQPVYTFAVERYDLPIATGLPREEVDRSMAAIRAYFTNDQDLLRITVTDEGGVTGPLFTPREVAHMRDVKVLVGRIFALQTVTLWFVVLYVAARLAVQGWRSLPDLARLTRLSMLGGVIFAAVFGVATLLGFDRLFEQFHLLSFSNDFWQLDPGVHRLVQLFPYDFWLAMTLLLVAMTAVEFVLLLSSAWAYERRIAEQGTETPSQSPTP